MLRTALAAATVLALAVLPATAQPAAPLPAGSGARLMGLTALDGTFSQFSRQIIETARVERIGDARFIAAWEASAREVFVPAPLDARLATSLEQGLTLAEFDTLVGIFSSPLAQRVTALDRAVLAIAPADQAVAIAAGAREYMASSPARRAQLDEVFALTGGDEMMNATNRVAFRGALLGYYLAQSPGTITVPWATIDAAVDAELASMAGQLREFYRGLIAYSYETLTDATLAEYVALLRQPATQRLYAVANPAIVAILYDTTLAFGDALARRLAGAPRVVRIDPAVAAAPVAGMPFGWIGQRSSGFLGSRGCARPAGRRDWKP